MIVLVREYTRGDGVAMAVIKDTKTGGMWRTTKVKADAALEKQANQGRPNA